MIALLVRSASQARYLLLASFALLFGFQLIIVGQAAQVGGPSFSQWPNCSRFSARPWQQGDAPGTFRSTVAFRIFHPVVVSWSRCGDAS